MYGAQSLGSLDSPGRRGMLELTPPWVLNGECMAKEQVAISSVIEWTRLPKDCGLRMLAEKLNEDLSSLLWEGE